MVVQNGPRVQTEGKSAGGRKAIDMLNGKNVVVIYQVALGAKTAQQGADELGVSLTTIRRYCERVKGSY